MAKQHVLLADGDEKSLRLMELALKQAGFTVDTVASGKRALKAIDERFPDLLISDIQLADIDGFELCQKIKSDPRTKTIIFVFLTSSQFQDKRSQGMELGAEEFLMKPISMGKVIDRAKSLLAIRVRKLLERAEEKCVVGDFCDAGVVDLVQAMDSEGKTGVIRLWNDSRIAEQRATLYFQEGKAIDAGLDRLVGERAFFRVLGWRAGRFELDLQSNHLREERISCSTPGLLIEGLRRIDEWTCIAEGLPSLETVMEVDCNILSERLAEIPDRVNEILRLFDGQRSLEQIIDQSDFEELSSLEIIQKLYAESLVREVELIPLSTCEPVSVSNREDGHRKDSPEQGVPEQEEVTEDEGGEDDAVLSPTGRFFHSALSSCSIYEVEGIQPLVPMSFKVSRSATSRLVRAMPGKSVEVHFFHPRPKSFPASLPEPSLVTSKEESKFPLVHGLILGGAAAEVVREDVEGKAGSILDGGAALDGSSGPFSENEHPFLNLKDPQTCQELRRVAGLERRRWPWAIPGVLLLAFLGVYHLWPGEELPEVPELALTEVSKSIIVGTEEVAPTDGSAPIASEPKEKNVAQVKEPVTAASFAAEKSAKPDASSPATDDASDEKTPSADVEYKRWLASGKAAYLRKRYVAATADFRKALKYRKDEAEAWVYLGMTVVESSPKEAVPYLEKGLAIAPRHAQGHVALGFAYQALERKAEAAEEYRKYLQLAPKGPYAEELRTILKGMRQ